MAPLEINLDFMLNLFSFHNSLQNRNGAYFGREKRNLTAYFDEN